jgi:hypothetical protein
MILYHGTDSDYLESIKSIGLTPEKSQSSLRAVFLTDDPYVAHSYNVMDSPRPVAGTPIILSVDTTKLDLSKFSPDNYELQDMLNGNEVEDELRKGRDNWNEFSPEESLQICNQVAYFGVIPWSAITGVHNYNPSTAELSNIKSILIKLING